MKMLLIVLLIIGALFLYTRDKTPDQKQGVLTPPQTRALEEAKAVDATLQKAEEERRKSLEAAEQ